jgi:rsbT co-antagonist protein RsbR
MCCFCGTSCRNADFSCGVNQRAADSVNYQSLLESFLFTRTFLRPLSPHHERRPMRRENQRLADLLRDDQANLLSGWAAEYHKYAEGRGLTRDLQAQQTSILRELEAGIRADGDADNFNDPAWRVLREVLAQLSTDRAAQGETADVTSGFVLALKRPIFDGLQRQTGGVEGQIDVIWLTSAVVDRMAQWTVATYQKTREDIIVRQQHELMELSTPSSSCGTACWRCR